jgi:MFS family permease
VVAVAAVAAVVIARPPTQRDPTPLSWRGSVLLATWLVALLVGVSNAGTAGWLSPATVVPVAAAMVLALAWRRAELRSDHPVIDLRLLRSPVVATVNGSTFLLGFGMFGAFMLVPLFVQHPAGDGFHLGLSAPEVALSLLPQTVGSMLIAPLGPVLARRNGSRVPLTVGAALAAIGYGSLVWANETIGQVSVALLFAGAGVGLAFAAVATLTVNAVPSHQRGQASAVNTIMRTVGGTLGTTTAATVLTSGGGSLASYRWCFALFAGSLSLCGLLARRVPTAAEAPEVVPPEAVLPEVVARPVVAPAALAPLAE